MSQPPALIEYRNVVVRRKGRAVLDGLNFSIGSGENVAILGPNGCGKSTMIKTITRELYPDPAAPDSSLKILGRDRWNIFELRPMLGIVSYDMVQLCTKNYPAMEIVLSGFHSSIGIWPNHVVTEEMEARAREVFGLLEIEHLAERPVDELSSGEARRVVIGRALVHKPKSLILDEPTNSLDLHAVHELRDLMRRIIAQGTSVILVTHHLQDIIPEMRRVILLKAGKVFADGPKERVLSSEALSGLFETPVDVERRDGYFHAW
ncbi:MAG: ATP-binding cassette domain-containing protein [Acidobacteria bacterium]|nr:ATP-binding cassette domain-containing protein [Acidobacteriota bacterium]